MTSGPPAREMDHAFVRAHHREVTQVLACFVLAGDADDDARSALRDLVLAAFVEGCRSGLQRAAPDDARVRQARLALHLLVATPWHARPAAFLPGSTPLVRACFVLAEATELPHAFLARLLHLSARRLARYAERARNRATSERALQSLGGAETTAPPLERETALLRERVLASVRDVDVSEILDALATPRIAGAPVPFDRAPFADTTDPEVKPVDEPPPTTRDARRASLRDLARLAAAPHPAAPAPSEGEGSALPLPTPTVPVDVPSHTAAVVSLSEPPPAARRRGTLRPLHVALLGVAALAGGVLFARPAPLVQAAHHDVHARRVPAAPTEWAAPASPVPSPSAPPSISVQSAPERSRVLAPAAPSTPEAARVPAPSSGEGLDAAMQHAVGAEAARPAEPAAPALTADAPRRPPQGAVTVALSKVTQAAKACIGPDDPISHATLTFVSSGRVVDVVVDGYAAGKPAARCIDAALRKAALPVFLDPDYRAKVTIRP